MPSGTAGDQFSAILTQQVYGVDVVCSSSIALSSAQPGIVPAKAQNTDRCVILSV